MRIGTYFKDRALFLLINFIIFIMICVIMLLINISVNTILLIFFIWFFPLLSYMFLEFIKYKNFYDKVSSIIDNLDKKYLLSEIIKEPEFIEGKVVYDLLKQANKSMHEHVKKYKDMESEYREYIEIWVHEIKNPIASARLIIENNQNEVTKNINYEIKKVEEYIEQVLYYARSNNVSKDYIIKEVSLNTLVRNVIKKNSRYLISKKISIDIDDIEGTVYGDVKWLEFILNQLIGNSIKYIQQNDGVLKVYTVKNENNIILTVEDNGVGIIDNDINRVFEKGFTGENGRRFGKSTGIGLYLCKKLSDQLGLGINVTSKVGKETKVNIIFPLGKVNLIS
ncbi:sensor histidine kinase [Clostridium algidicarnis]|uniref:sensor histidine kinase n=1 Tax=Clostridium algidicarnis TaxID=37659 RepID=UPI000496A053|nr:sensor histidine kinase [Clostridium algidicarnis]MBB6696588.1 sensor histidine kinase [Clostridium algidicarnis]MBU3202782.1 sensor histidine kinase [Clostridium algidicarnis]MBU3210936.1 sensor histidine kinase [Clostridium algidicarnis]MBU3222556.1 sensor histidine kinase [Clostridium algidicarnis]